MRKKLILLTFTMLSVGAGAVMAQNNAAMKYMESGIKALDAGNYFEAGFYFSNAIKKDPLCSLCYLAEGRARIGENKYDGAMISFNNAIRIDPKCELCYIVRGRTQAALENYDSAIADFTKAIKVGNPKDAYEAKMNIYLVKTRIKLMKILSPPEPIKIVKVDDHSEENSDYRVTAGILSYGRVVDRVSLTVNGNYEGDMDVREVWAKKNAKKGSSAYYSYTDYEVSSKWFTLTRGENTIKIEVAASGDTASRTFTVTYTPPTAFKRFATYLEHHRSLIAVLWIAILAVIVAAVVLAVRAMKKKRKGQQRKRKKIT